MNSLFRKAIEQYFAQTQRVEVYHVIFNYGPGYEGDSAKAFEIRIYTKSWDVIADYRNQEAVEFLDRLLDYTGA
ncbi:hypothetical protein ABZ960_20610 [Streptomyces pseudovenezuelae]|uniref:hypothetical protein n=1 Tax=Streptomyces pseudovenezuelae TaxID=67350 RepID=UPI0034A14731